MKIPSALRKLFDNISITYTYDGQSVTDKAQFHYGSQHELNKWIASMTQGNYNKYPLIWYVIDEEPEFNGVIDANVRLILFQGTKPEWFNNQREEETYNTILYPLLTKIKYILDTNLYVQVYANDRTKKYDVLSEPNYGVNSQTKNDFNSTTTQGSKQITLDTVDALILDFKARFKVDCIK